MHHFEGIHGPTALVPNTDLHLLSKGFFSSHPTVPLSDSSILWDHQVHNPHHHQLQKSPLLQLKPESKISAGSDVHSQASSSSQGDDGDPKNLTALSGNLGEGDQTPNSTVGPGSTSKVFADCVVCHDKSSGKHYGQFSCEGCKSFFKRSVRRNLVYSCRGNKNCPVDIQHRNQCQFCRFNKCLQSGMRRESVQRGRINSLDGGMKLEGVYSTRPTWLSYQDNGVSSTGGGGVGGGSSIYSPVVTMTTPGLYGLTGFVGQLVKMQPFTTPNFSGLPNTGMNLDTLSDLSCHLLAFVVDWAKRLPQFSQDLHLGDQMLLLKHSWHPLLVLMAAQSYLPIPVASLMATASVHGGSDQMVTVIDQLRSIQKQLERFHRLMPTPAEYACLRALVLFNPDIYNLNDAVCVENVQQKTQCGLEEHVKTMQPHQPSRFSNLLMRLVPLCCLSQSAVERVFFSQIVAQKSGVEYLIGDWLFGSSNQSRAGAASSNSSSILPASPIIGSATGGGAATYASSLPIGQTSTSGQYSTPYGSHWQPWGSQQQLDYSTFAGSPFYNANSGGRK